MEKHKAIPQGYMTVGEVAKKMGVSNRTLQYYDEEGLFSPSSESEGGRRLYTNKDVIKLYQIISLKHLGFSLNDIKNRLIPLDTPADVANALTEQAEAIKAKIDSLFKSLKEIEALKAEVLQMQLVDFKKYADIITNLQMKNEFYWLIKHFDDHTLEHFRNHFTKETGIEMMKKYSRLNNEAKRLQNEGASPKSEPAQNFAKEFWAMIMEFTHGDMSLLPNLMEVGNRKVQEGGEQQAQALATAFIEQALEAYFDSLGYDPLEEETR